MNTLRNSLAIAALAVTIGFLPQAHADIVMKVSDGTNTGMADDHSNPGLASFSGPIGNFTVSVDLGAGFPQVGSPSDPVLDLTSLDLTTGNGGGILTVMLTETDFMLAAAEQFTSSIAGNYMNASVTLDTYLDTTNAHFGTGMLLSSGLLNNQTGVTSVPALAGPFSLTEILTVSAGPKSLTSADAAILVPEPQSLSLLGAALFALGLFGSSFALGRQWSGAVRA